MRLGRFDRERRLDRNCGRILITAFVSQAIVRLALLGFWFKLGWSSLPVHAFSLFVVMPFLAGMLVVAGQRPIARAAAVVPIAATWLLLTLFDVGAIAAALLQSRPMTFDDLANFYCDGRVWTSCLYRFPQLTVPLAVGFLVLAAGLYRCAGSLRSAFRNIADRVGRRSPIGLLPILVAAGLAYVGLWIAVPSFMSGREPIAYMLKVRPFVDGPLELRFDPRPHARVMPSTQLRPRPIVLITVDSLRADAVELGANRPTLTPFLRSLAPTGNLMNMGPAVAACSSTYCGVVAIHGSQSWATLERGPPLTLADILSANGYKSYFLLSSSHRSNAHLAELYGKVTELRDDMSPDSSGFFDDRNQLKRLENLRLDQSDRTFIAIHLMSAHSVGRRFGASRTLPWTEVRHLTNEGGYASYYAGGVRQADRVISSIFAILKARGILDDALVVITADHGERMEAVDGGTHGGAPDVSTALVPFLVYDSRRPGHSDHGVVSHADIAPTILDAVGAAIPDSWQGRSILRPWTRPAAPTDSATATAMVAEVAGRLLLFTCDLESGETTIAALDGTPLTPASQTNAKRKAPVLYKTLVRRKDSASCFSGI